MGVNHFGHHKLTMKLLPFMQNTLDKDKRIVVLSSNLHRFFPKDILFDDITMENDNYSGGISPRYCHSKLANILFANELNRKLKNSNINITVNSVHPGIIRTELHRNDSGLMLMLINPFFALVRKNLQQGVSTTIYGAVSSELAGKGGYYLDNNYIGNPLEVANDEEKARKLWDLTESITGEKYPFFF